MKKTALILACAAERAPQWPQLRHIEARGATELWAVQHFTVTRITDFGASVTVQ